MKIGVFDSGIGGEAVAVRLRQLLPNAEVITAHDHEHVPYGTKPATEVYKLTKAALQPLFEASCDVIVLACNTATAAAIDKLRIDYPDMPFVGLEPMVKPACAITRTDTIVVCATPTTLASERYQSLKSLWASGKTIIEPDCSTWAEAIEHGNTQTINLDPLTTLVREQSADVIVLACTHYHWLKQDIAQAVGPHVTILEPSDAIAAQILRIIEADSTKAR